MLRAPYVARKLPCARCAFYLALAHTHTHVCRRDEGRRGLLPALRVPPTCANRPPIYVTPMLCAPRLASYFHPCHFAGTATSARARLNAALVAHVCRYVEAAPDQDVVPDLGDALGAYIRHAAALPRGT